MKENKRNTKARVKDDPLYRTPSEFGSCCPLLPDFDMSACFQGWEVGLTLSPRQMIHGRN
jgi:hypothetical protein